MKRIILTLSIFLFSSPGVAVAYRLKDVATIKGVRENQILGYGLVVGLNGTGDEQGEVANASLKRMLKTLGLVPQKELASKNIAAVIVTAKLPPFARVGQRLDVNVASIGGASSLAGGTLLVTPLKGGDGKIYAVASGQISIGGLKKGSKFATSGRVASGGTVERELKSDFDQKKSLRLTLNSPDFTTAARIEKTLNEQLGGQFASAKDSSTVDLVVPTFYQRKLVQLVAIVENFTVHTDQQAKIIINERTGTIVAGGGLKLRPVAIAHGELSIQIGPQGGLQGSFQGLQRPPQGSLHLMDGQSTLNDLVKGLNAMGTTPEDLISIFQALKQNGALVASLEFI